MFPTLATHTPRNSRATGGSLRSASVSTAEPPMCRGPESFSDTLSRVATAGGGSGGVGGCRSVSGGTCCSTVVLAGGACAAGGDDTAGAGNVVSVALGVGIIGRSGAVHESNDALTSSMATAPIACNLLFNVCLFPNCPLLDAPVKCEAPHLPPYTLYRALHSTSRAGRDTPDAALHQHLPAHGRDAPLRYALRLQPADQEPPPLPEKETDPAAPVTC